MDHHYQTMNPHPPNPLIMHYINPPPPALVHTKFFAGTPPPRDPPIPPPHCRVLSTPPPRKKGATEKTNPPVWKPIAHLLLTVYLTTSI